MTVYLKWVEFYEKSSSKKKASPRSNSWSSMHIWIDCAIKRPLAKIAPRDGGKYPQSAALPHTGAAVGVCTQHHLLDGLFCHG